ncbi:hypothetical protein ABAC460_16650 [Asticcacaulis sp. AC460]|uniref:CHAT domain-containing protein n=1 Tax=Asticcacaulis sp. AC460 TaxID=1282360 RepID=UPI0003C3D7A7|nr:CHAT domain-containing protein [Asticcacaulis sp. AC460]ESQ88289.1 hypothetical protein ABAC460_16650 [Asticcacaulis sp. AC460]
MDAVKRLLLPMIAALTAALAFTLPAAAQEPAPTPLEESFEAAQWADLSVTAQALARAAGRNSATSPELKTLIDRLETAKKEYEALDQAANAARGGASEAAKFKAKTLAEAADQAHAEVETLSAELAQKYPAYDSLVAPFPIGLKQTQGLLRPDEALVMIHPTPNGTYIFALRNGDAQWFRTDATTDSLRPDVDAMRFALDPGREALRGAASHPGGLPTQFTFSRQTAYRLYQQVFAPAQPVIKDAKVVYIVASGPLSHLPLSVLVTTPPKGNDLDVRALRKTDWLIKSYALATLPSVNSLKFLRQARNDAAPGRGFLGFGSPDLATDGKTRDLVPLPGAQTELLAMAKLMNADTGKQVYTGAQATEKAVRENDLSNVRIIAFATHAVRAGEVEGMDEPALVLTEGGVSGDANNDGFLTASEAANLRLNADWVILSACNTASGRKKAGDDNDEVLSGLARGFLASGAHSLIVSHWRVSDQAAAQLTSAAVGYYVGGKGRAEALQTAMLDMLARGDATPANWAAMVVVGEAR